MTPKVLDLSHHNSIDDPIADGFAQIRAAGVVGIIHKVTQGLHYVDPRYAPRRQAAIDAGLLWGAYHFATGDDIDAQIAHFLEAAAPDEKTLLALDHEPNEGDQLDLDGARTFLRSIEAKVGRRAVLYSGNLIKEQLGNEHDAEFAAHRLWIAQYGPAAHVPPCWSTWWLWQYSEHGEIAGASGALDLNTYAGTDEQLAADWAS